MGKRKRYFLLFLGMVFMVTGCASKPPEPRIPTEKIRERADRAFEDVKSEETKDKALPRPSAQSDTEQRDTVQVTKGKRPAWVNGDSIQYPSSKYLTGVGYDPDRKSAEDKARAEIAKIFFSKIDSRTRSYQDYLQTTSKGKSKIEETLSIEEVTKVSSQKVLSGVRVSHVYHETGTESMFYALAVLNREQSAKILRDKIGELDRGIKGILSNANRAEDMLTKVKYLKRSIQEHILREAYDAELRIVSRSGGGVSPPVSFTELKSKLESVLLRDFLIGVTVSGSRANEIQDALVQGLNQQGFAISEDLSRANVIVRGTVKIRPLDRGTSEWKYVQWRTHFDMVDKRGESVFGSVNKSGREGHLNLTQAENRAVRKIQKALTTEIAEEMKRYIFSQ
ncbi:MAG: LPP20 family lipoprotein [Deltaproteobacteria bacterium]|nr:LPP20 family lipoprotein [Deltaproteobacteria bacterium]